MSSKHFAQLLDRLRLIKTDIISARVRINAAYHCEMICIGRRSKLLSDLRACERRTEALINDLQTAQTADAVIRCQEGVCSVHKSLAAIFEGFSSEN